MLLTLPLQGQNRVQGVQHMPETGSPRAAPAVPRLCVVLILSSSPRGLPNQAANGDMKTCQEELFSGFWEKKIVNVLVPFTKPQPKKVTQKIPERKQCSRLWLRHPSCGWELWPSGHTTEGGSREVASPSPSGL